MPWPTLEYKAAHLPLTATFLEAWTEFQHVASEDERQSLIAKPTPEAVTRFLKSPDTERYVRNTAFAFFKPTDYPTHDLLLHLMQTAPFPEHDRKRSRPHGKLTRSVERTAAYFRSLDNIHHREDSPISI